MRLLKISVENWRGIDSRHVAFSDGVTLIEGPNEIGKSTIVEAIRMLFNELDSSKRQTVKAIKPVDQDVGSTVKAEVTSGEYHFEFSKTFNKTAQTTLNVLAPRKKQVTGREAHEAVAQMLGETVDMALWDALLVDQGEKVALANIQDSSGLAKALDDSAGGSATGSDDTGLYEAAQAEYERFFTLKTGKPKFAAEEAEFERSVTSLKAARQSLVEVETTVEAHDRSAAEVLRIRAELPRLKEIADEYGRDWQTIQTLKDTVSSKTKELADARAIQQAAVAAQKNRMDLIEDVSISQTKVAEAKTHLEPLQLDADKIRDQARRQQLEIETLRKQEKAARLEFDLVYADEQHLQRLELLTREKIRLDQLREIARDKTSSVTIVGSIQINDASLERLREAESSVAIARGSRNTAATTISVEAENPLVFEMNGDEISLHASEVETRTIASPLRLRLPGVVSVEITPPRTVAELQATFEESQETLSQLLRQFGVASLRDAVAANERRADAQRTVDRLKVREQEILAGASVEEIEQAIASCQAACDRYSEQRQSQQDFPANLVDASRRVSEAKSELTSRNASLEQAQEMFNSLQIQYADLDGRLRIAQQNLAGLEAALADKEGRLLKLRSDVADSVLAERAGEATAATDNLENAVATLNAKLDGFSPDSLEALMNNSQSAWERARTDLIAEEQNLAVLVDRLQQAQADGRFEAMEAAERDLEASRVTLESIQRRAKAIELLWNTLNKHRDATRRTYVQPLKEAIERLGRIVFGISFEIEIGDDWSVRARTLNGLTLPFESLSIGAKEQLGILARLAAAQIVAKHGGVPLIIDDALGFSDPARLETIGAAITSAGKEIQVIILTCTPGRFTHVGSANVVRF